jgi:hypothetical protein
MYITYAELVQRYDVIASWGGSEAVVNSALIYYAEMELHSRLASHYSVPFSAAHPTVKDLALDLAYLKALRTRDPQRAKEIEAAVLGRIEAIKSGKEYIYTGSGTVMLPEGAGGEIWSTTRDYHPVHSLLDPEEEVIDEDRLDAEEDERS